VALIADICRNASASIAAAAASSVGLLLPDSRCLLPPLSNASTISSANNRTSSTVADTVSEYSDDAAPVGLAAVVDGGHMHVERLQTLINHILPAQGDSRIDRMCKALASVWLERNAEVVQRHQSNLVLRISHGSY
jgi:hypothetical protein